MGYFDFFPENNSSSLVQTAFMGDEMKNTEETSELAKSARYYHPLISMAIGSRSVRFDVIL